MVSQTSKTTTNHDEIRRWVEERGGVPATVAHTERDEEAGVLRIKFPGYGEDEQLEEVSWDDWFEKFEESDVAFLYQDQTSDGEISTFNKLVSRS